MWLNLWMMEEWNDYRRVHNLFVMNSLMKMIHRTVDEKHRTSERETNQFRTQKSQSAYSSVLPIESNMTYQPIFHNYVRPREGSEGKTPAEACGIKIDGKNKWLTLIQNATRKK